MFLKTLRDDPSDADVRSHQLLVRAGYIRRVAPGIYSWLPLGLQVLGRVAAVVRDEMEAIGAHEVLFPALLPREPYETTGRWSDYGEGIFRLKDRRNGDYLLGPTHEEMFTLMVKGECSSYKDLPLSLFQIQTKYRDEARPRGGILRGREFVMKDSYSFDLDDAGLAASYRAHRDAYVRIFDRLGVRYRIVSAVSGAMGGSASEEFLAVAPAGEDTFVACTSCDYAANVEAAEVRSPAVTDPAAPPLEVVDTPDTPTIDALVAVLQGRGLDVAASDTLKNVVVMLQSPDGQRVPLVIGVPGDRDIDIKALAANVAPSIVEPFEAADFADHPGLIRGYIGPQGLADLGIRYVVDTRVTDGSSWVTGANVEGRHALNVTMGRDFVPDGVVAAAEVRGGDRCPRCGEPLNIDRGIEIGHVFQLGRKYADAFGLDVLGPHGKPVRVTMGSYGIGVSRAVAVIAEQTCNAGGLCWPREVAPADVHVLGVGKVTASGLDPQTVAGALASALAAAGVRVLLDDRGTSPGVAFSDADLLGVPTIVTIGKALADGNAEVKDRRTGERTLVPITDIVKHVVRTEVPTVGV